MRRLGLPWALSQAWRVAVSCGVRVGAEFWSMCMNQSISWGLAG